MLRECPLDHRCMRGIPRGERSLERGTADPVRPAVFLDRDGTMIEDVGYLDAIARVAFYPWTIDAIRALNRAGLAVVVVTNQSGIARGFFSEAFVEATHRHIAATARGGRRAHRRVLLLPASSARHGGAVTRARATAASRRAA